MDLSNENRILTTEEAKSTRAFTKAFKNHIKVMSKNGFTDGYKKTELELFFIEGNKVFEQVEDLCNSWDMSGQGFSLLEDVFVNYASMRTEMALPAMKQYSSIVLLISRLIEKQKVVDLLANMFLLYDEVQDKTLLEL